MNKLKILRIFARFVVLFVGGKNMLSKFYITMSLFTVLFGNVAGLNSKNHNTLNKEMLVIDGLQLDIILTTLITQ